MSSLAKERVTLHSIVERAYTFTMLQKQLPRSLLKAQVYAMFTFYAVDTYVNKSL